MPNITLTTTPGLIATSTTRVDAAALNLIANPLVELVPTGGMGVEFLDLAALTTAIAPGVRGRNLLPRCAFAYQDWRHPEGSTVAAGGSEENAYDWTCRPVGGKIKVIRAEVSYNNLSTWAAQLQVDDTYCASVSYVTWISSSIGGNLRTGNVCFSLMVKNLQSNTIYACLTMTPAQSPDLRNALGTMVSGTNTPLLPGVWTRLQIVVDAATQALQNGAEIGLKTDGLTASGQSLQLCQAQLEQASAPTPWLAPLLPATDVVAPYPIFGPGDKLEGARLVVQTTSGQMRYFDGAPNNMVKPVVTWNKLGFPEWIDLGSNKVVFAFTGQDQFVTAPTGATFVKFWIWGAGGSNDAPDASGAVKGGVGGFTYGKMAVTAGQKLAIVVGEGAHGLARRAYGFGGAGQGSAHQHNGGGLSGIFYNNGYPSIGLQAGDTGRAIAIAGGGGCGGQSGGGNNGSQGGNGNDAGSAGGSSTMQGADAYGTQSNGEGGGGGGYSGGTGLGLGGKGGTGYLAAAAMLGTLGTDYGMSYSIRPSLIIPESSRPEYQTGVGGSGQPGLVVLEWIY